MTYFAIITASKIHISFEMKKALDSIGGYRTEHRGLVDVKVCQSSIKC